MMILVSYRLTKSSSIKHLWKSIKKSFLLSMFLLSLRQARCSFCEDFSLCFTTTTMTKTIAAEEQERERILFYDGNYKIPVFHSKKRVIRQVCVLSSTQRSFSPQVMLLKLHKIVKLCVYF